MEQLGVLLLCTGKTLICNLVHQPRRTVAHVVKLKLLLEFVGVCFCVSVAI